MSNNTSESFNNDDKSASLSDLSSSEGCLSSSENVHSANSNDKKQQNWLKIQSDLKQALNTWDELSIQLADKKSPEEEKLEEFKRLLNDVKTKLNELSK